MSEQQIKDYLKKYRIDSEEQLVKHIEELKRNTIPNNEIIFLLVDLLVNEKAVLLSFFAENKKQELFTRTVTPFFLDEAVISYQSLTNGKFKDNTVTYTSTRHKSKAGETHKETTEYLQGIKESQTTEKAPIFTYCKVNKNALEALALRALYGHKRYNINGADEDWQNFTRVPNGDFEYSNAMFRHALEIGREEDEKEHLISSAWNAISRLEIYLRNNQK